MTTPASEPPSPPEGDRRRRPRSVYDSGQEPDVRVSMANERTALAWLRTALSVVAAGVGLTTLARVSGGAAELDVVARETDRFHRPVEHGP